MRKKRSFIQKLVRMGLWICLGIVALLVIVQLFLSFYLPGILRHQIEKVVVSGSDSLYQCKIEKLSVNFWRGRVALKNVQISMDSARYKQLESEGKLPGLTMDISLAKGSINGLKIIPLLFNRKIYLNTIAADSADINLQRHTHATKDTVQTKEKQPLWKILQPHIKGIYIKQIALDNIRFNYQHGNGNKSLKFEYDNCSARLINIQLDSAGAQDPLRVLFTEDLAIHFKGVRFHAEDSLYQVRLGDLGYSSLSRSAKISKFALIPTLSPAEFTRKHGQQVDIYQVEFGELEVRNFEIAQIFSDNTFHCDTIVVDTPRLTIHRDRTAPKDTISKYGKYPYEALKNAPFKIQIPVLELKEASVRYIEKQAQTHKEGNLFFNGIHGSIKNITNDSADWQKDPHCVIDVAGLFLGRGEMTAVFDFNLGDKDGEFTAKAHLKSMPAEIINKISVDFANLKFNSGHIHSALFTLHANNNGSTGKLHMLYDDLNLELLKVDVSKQITKEQKFLSFLANAIAVRKMNPAKDGKETVAEGVFVARTRVQPFFNLVWKTLFYGIKDILLKGAAKNIKLGDED